MSKRLTRNLFSLLKPFITSHPPHDLATRLFKRILVVKQHDQLGDMLCVVSLLRGLRIRYPDAYIVLVTSPVNNAVMLQNPFLNRVINYDKREFLDSGRVRIFKFLRFVRALRKERFELAIVPSTVSMSVTSDLIAFLSRAKYRIGAAEINGVANASAALFNVPVKLKWEESGHRHQALRNLDIAHDLWLNVADLSSTIKLTDSEISEAQALVASWRPEVGEFIVYHPGAGKPPNRWPAERFAQLADTLAAESTFGTVITSGPMDSEPVQIVKSVLTRPYQLVENMAIRQVAAVLSLASFVVSNDTGIMHVAAAVGTPVLSLFGPTDPEQWAPIGTKHRYIRGEGGDVNAIGLDDVLALSREMIQQQLRMPLAL